mmetsp:Transcript_39434/g.101088  ORF Transcript_39434/g.101088 Transcript_39434/m.101088 type:complete len:104 (+) Transcript_39434:307-618(+)
MRSPNSTVAYNHADRRRYLEETQIPIFPSSGPSHRKKPYFFGLWSPDTASFFAAVGLVIVLAPSFAAFFAVFVVLAAAGVDVVAAAPALAAASAFFTSACRFA